MQKINVAITIAITQDPDQKIWINGGNQHCVFLYFLLKRSSIVKNVWLVHSDGITVYPDGLHLDEIKPDVKQISEVIGQTDLLIEMGTQVASDHVTTVRNRGGKIVTYRFGNDYVITVEIFNFNNIVWQPNLQNSHFDEVWTNPQHEHTCKSYWEVLYKSPVYVLPHIWTPHFLDIQARELESCGIRFGYKCSKKQKRIAMFEPNMNVVKSSLLPMLACSEVFNRRPELIEHVYMTNTFRIKEVSAFKHIALGLPMVQKNKATSEGRFSFAYFAAQHTDVIISHQWENGLNYLYYDALYGHYPLVHNSPFLRDVGYYYRDFDVSDAANALQYAIEMHDSSQDEYQRKCDDFLEKVNAVSQHNIDAYTARINELFHDKSGEC
jgi:hypothetical protein